MSGGGTGLMSGGGLSTGSGGLMSGCEGFSIMAVLDRCKIAARVAPYTSSPMARINAIALLCSTTPGRIR